MHIISIKLNNKTKYMYNVIFFASFLVEKY